MPRSVIVEGKTTTEAMEKGLKELKVSKEMVDVKVLEEGNKKSFYSILTPRVVKIELTVKENIEKGKEEVFKGEKRVLNTNIQEIDEALENINKFLDKFLDKTIKYEVSIEEFDINVNIEGENINYLIGYRGETINALQVVLSSIANKKSSSKIRVILDIAGYKDKRKKTLEDLAEKIARTVVRTGKSISLEPMTAYERKIIHTKLQKNNKVQTYSKGEEPYRKVVISLK